MLRINHFTKIYGAKRAVDDLSIAIDPGCVYGFIGHNGAGKTTTLKACCGIIAPDGGEIFVDGINVMRDPTECKRRLAYIPDNPDVYEFLSGMKYLNFIADVYDLSAAERKERIEKYVDLFSLGADIGRPISGYSHGMKQKLALISAFIRRPRLLLLDEPFVGLDPTASHIVKGLMRDLCSEGGAVFFSTHVLEVAEKLCDRVAIIKQGRLIAEGRTEDVCGDKSLESVFLELEG